MRGVKKFDVGFIIACAVFSTWFFGKSFGYDSRAGAMWVARNQVGDFGLHLSLVRSFSWGNNFPPQSPFYPGIPLPYHYLFDLLAGLISRAGVRIDIAVNGLSIISMTALLYCIYLFSQAIFGQNRRVGLLSVLLFLSPGGWSFLDFFRSGGPATWLRRWWSLPDYIHSGPFDGSIFSTYFTLNVFLNQRHLIAAFAISLALLLFVYRKVTTHKRILWYENIAGGAALGVLFWLHSLLFVANSIVLGLLFVMYRRQKDAGIFFGSAFIVALPRLWVVARVAGSHPWWNPGFLTPTPPTFGRWLSYWWQNTGVVMLLIPIGVIIATPRQRVLWWCILPLFILANVFQLSFRIEHNHSFFNYFFLVGNIYGAYALDHIWRRNIAGKAAACVLVLAVGMSGLMQFPAVKNDYRYVVPDAPSNALMAWIVQNTPKKSIFLGPAELMDPVTLSGRYTYVGASYYLEAIGYRPLKRRESIQSYLEHPDDGILRDMRGNGISFVLVPRINKPDYPYAVDTAFYDTHTRVAYTDENYFVYQL